MRVRTDTDTGAWQRGADQLLARVMSGTVKATRDSTFLVEREGKRRLRRYTHPRGTPTPAPPGGPPALVSGHLRRTWRSTPPRPGKRPWTVEAETGPTADYARIQELGGEVRQVRTQAVVTRNTAGVESVHTRTRMHRFRLPKRPYVKPTVVENRRNIHRIYVTYWTRAIIFT